MSHGDRQGAAVSQKRHVEIRLLRYVIAVAEELHFGRASKRLHLSPPSLSKQIKDLEGNLGYLLFERKTRHVVVTPAGSAFVAEARRALVHVEQAVEYGYAASCGDTGTFLVGYSPWFRPSLLLAIQEAFSATLPRTRFELRSTYSATQIDRLVKGDLQVGIVELPADVPGLQTQCVWRDELVVALPVNHRLAHSGEVDRHDLVAEPIIWLGSLLHPRLCQHLLESLQCRGQALRIVQDVTTLAEMLDLVAAGSGIGFVKRSFAAFTSDLGVAFRELREPRLPIDTGIAYRVDNQSEALRVFIQLVREQQDQRVTLTSGAGLADCSD